MATLGVEGMVWAGVEEAEKVVVLTVAPAAEVKVVVATEMVVVVTVMAVEVMVMAAVEMVMAEVAKVTAAVAVVAMAVAPQVRGAVERVAATVVAVVEATEAAMVRAAMETVAAMELEVTESEMGEVTVEVARVGVVRGAVREVAGTGKVAVETETVATALVETVAMVVSVEGSDAQVPMADRVEVGTTAVVAMATAVVVMASEALAEVAMAAEVMEVVLKVGCMDR